MRRCDPAAQDFLAPGNLRRLNKANGTTEVEVAEAVFRFYQRTGVPGLGGTIRNF